MTGITDNLTPTGTYTVNDCVDDVTFADAAGVLKRDDIGQLAGTVMTYQAGDSFDVSRGTLSRPVVNNGLIPVKLVIDGTTIAQIPRDRVTYFHMQLSRHAVILAEGPAEESYLDRGDRANFHVG